MSRQTLVRRLSRCDQIHLQGILDILLGQAGGQPPHKPSRPPSLPSPFSLDKCHVQGVFVLQDNTFKPISRISSWQGRSEALKRAKIVCSSFLRICLLRRACVQQYVALPAGLIRGALARIGLHGSVTTEITSLPHCTLAVFCSPSYPLTSSLP